MARLWRLYQPDLPEGRGAVVEIGPEESRHARKVLRLRAGEPVAVFDGAGREWTGLLLDSDGARARVRLEHELVEPAVDPSLELTLFQAALRPERMDWVVQKATEIGVAAIRLFVPERAEAIRLGEQRLGRFKRIAIESCKQSGRRRLPLIDVLEELPRSDPAETTALLLHPSADSRPLAERCPETAPRRCWLAVGPQGGFSESESQTHRERGWLPTSLGPRVLRADTAGVVSSTILLHRWADLGSPDGASRAGRGQTMHYQIGPDGRSDNA